MAISEYIILGIFALMAGFLDSIVGGGGLIQLPGILTTLPQAPVPVAAGTNKFASIWGTSSAALRYSREVRIPWRLILPALVAAFFGSALGATILTRIPNDFLKPLILVLLIVMVIYTAIKKDFGAKIEFTEPTNRDRRLALGLGGLIGLYDGFFGPGTGTFLIFLMIRVFKLDFLSASASAKVINVGTNLSACLLLASAGNILWTAGLVMAVFNVLGSLLGARMAIQNGSGFVRKVFLIVVTALIAKLFWDLLRPT